MRLEISHTYVVTDEIATKFLYISNDTNLMHVSDSFARSHGFQSRISHGNILNCFVSHFVGVLLQVSNIIIHTQYIEYRKPFFTGDTIDFSAQLIESYESMSTYVYSFKFCRNHEIVASGKVQVGVLE